MSTITGTLRVDLLRDYYAIGDKIWLRVPVTARNPAIRFIGRWRTTVVVYDAAGRMLDKTERTHFVPWTAYIAWLSAGRQIAGGLSGRVELWAED